MISPLLTKLTARRRPRASFTDFDTRYGVRFLRWKMLSGSLALTVDLVCRVQREGCGRRYYSYRIMYRAQETSNRGPKVRVVHMSSLPGPN